MLLNQAVLAVICAALNDCDSWPGIPLITFVASAASSPSGPGHWALVEKISNLEYHFFSSNAEMPGIILRAANQIFTNFEIFLSIFENSKATNAIKKALLLLLSKYHKFSQNSAKITFFKNISILNYGAPVSLLPLGANHMFKRNQK